MRLSIREGRAYLQAPVTPRLSIAVRQLEGRRAWLANGQFSFEPSRHNLAIIQTNLPGVVVERMDALADYDTAPQPAPRPPYVQKTEPFGPYQQECLEKSRTVRHFANFMEQGLGKSKCAIDRAGELFAEGKIDACLVISKKGAHRQWIEGHFPKHYGASFVGDFWGNGPKKDKLRSDLYPSDEALKVLSFNIDGVKTTAGRQLAQKFITAHRGRVLFVFDESQQAKDDKTLRWQAVEVLAMRCAYRMLLSGTPIADDLTDEWAQFKILDPNIIGIRYKTAFRNTFCVLGGYEMRQVVGVRNLDKFHELTAPYIFRITKAEAGWLPKTYDQFEFDLDSMQRRMIRSMKEAMYAQLLNGEMSIAVNAAVASLRVQQISNGFTTNEDGVVTDLYDDVSKNPRIAAMLDFLEANPGPCVIWCRFIRDVENVAKALGDQCVTYYGNTSDRDRAKNIDVFLRPDGPLYFVANPQAAGTGLDGLQMRSEQALYYSNADNPIDRQQSEDRIDRIGSDRAGSRRFTDLFAKGSADARIIRNHKMKKSFSQLALNDIKEWLQEDM